MNAVRMLTLAVAVAWVMVFGLLIWVALQIAPTLDALQLPIR